MLGSGSERLSFRANGVHNVRQQLLGRRWAAADSDHAHTRQRWHRGSSRQGPPRLNKRNSRRLFDRSLCWPHSRINNHLKALLLPERSGRRGGTVNANVHRGSAAVGPHCRTLPRISSQEPIPLSYR